MVITWHLRRRALDWFQTRPENIRLSLEQIFDYLGQLFDRRPNSLELRRKFEARGTRKKRSQTTFTTKSSSPRMHIPTRTNS
ncbi:hypothetical protein WN48_09188 [Eufriesea mexicana]|uniref:Uncharacterized protein n=1 Tax=Eufriesea mexicana TaxID=516756 RepID=A0A310SJ19_9HYME|nr:hypothetical protein WN48_09188 [Eufriesea mexicana]